MINKYKNTSAFSLAELILVTIILVILGTIAFISLREYTKNARDSVRETDIKNISTQLNLFKSMNGFYPEPSSGYDITYAGTNVWSQGTIGDSVIFNLQSLNKKSVDPFTNSEYTYSRLTSRDSFQIASVLESGSNQGSQIEGKKTATAYITGDYKCIMTKVNSGGTTYILAVPSLISGSSEGSDIASAFNNLIIDGGEKLPNSYADSIFDIQADGSSSFVQTSDYVVFSGSIYDFQNEDQQIFLINQLQKAYSGTSIENNFQINALSDYDTILNTEGTKFLAQTMIKKCLNSDIKVTAKNTTKSPLFGSSILSYYSFDKNYTDAGILGNNGIVNNDASIDSSNQNSYRKSYVTFGGAAGYIELPHNSAYELSDGTISLWAQVNKPDAWSGLFSKDEFQTNTPGHITIGIDYSKFYYRLQEIGDEKILRPVNPVVGTDWKHMVASFGGDGMKFFINGSIIQSNGYTGGTIGNTNPIALGASIQASQTGQLLPLDGYFDGSIDELIIYDKQLSDDEVLELYNSQK
ncbi:hypothetical protein A9Q91_05375 [Candidatus Gracilibacteria bacterium 28_42_T64]|nr:hypothetical protein A9Q91_05375 [Candidatus Gracilibacteria bacterium 28_42_T64]